MKTIHLLVLSTALLPVAAFAQDHMDHMAAPAPATGPAAEVLRSYTTQKTNVIKAAEKMPEADYLYKPTPEVRSFAKIVLHVVEAQFQSCSAQTGTKFDRATMVPAETASKTDIVAALKASFDACDKAYALVTDQNLGEQVAMGPNKRSRVTLAWGNVSHDNEQYAELSTYLRLKNLVPPTAEK